MPIPNLFRKLNKKQLETLQAFSNSCRISILEMTTNAGSGHPGGSLSSLDFLTLLYSYIISQTGEKIVISNGHISPAVYSVLAELGYISKDDVIKNFRTFGSKYEGHVTRHVPGVWFGTGPLGAGVSAACGFALAEKINTKNKKKLKKVFAIIGDGESQEGQVYEMMHAAAKEKLHNFIVFMDYNQVQLSNSLDKIMPYNPAKTFEAAGWKVITVDGHNYQQMWHALARAYASTDKPVLILGNTIMGKGVKLMEKDGQKHKSTWHGKTAKPKDIIKSIKLLELNSQQKFLLEDLRKNIKYNPKRVLFKKLLSKTKIKTGTNKLYKKDELTDCRTAYGKALLDLATKNKDIIAITADVASSVKTSYVKDAIPKQHVDVGIAEQHMVSSCGGLSLNNITPFCSTFGVFMTSRAKDQMRVNDINQTNVKMVATHCGLSVGQDGPTHQAIDDNGSVLGLLNTLQLEPADPNHCDRLTRYIASHYGNVYMRMGRHKVPVLTKQNGQIFYDKTYKYEYGKCDVLRSGKDVTIVAIGAVVHEALEAQKKLKEKNISAEIIIASSIKKFDNNLIKSIKKTQKVITIEDHNIYSGLGSQVAKLILEKNIKIKKLKILGIDHYQLSGNYSELYKAAGIDSDAIIEAVRDL